MFLWFIHRSFVLFIHSFIILPFIHDLLIHSTFIHRSSFFVRSFIHSFVHLFIYSFIRSFTRSFIHSFIHSFIQPFIHPFIHSSIHSSIRIGVRDQFRLGGLRSVARIFCSIACPNITGFFPPKMAIWKILGGCPPPPPALYAYVHPFIPFHLVTCNHVAGGSLVRLSCVLPRSEEGLGPEAPWRPRRLRRYEMIPCMDRPQEPRDQGGRAGFRRGQSGQLPRGPHKKGPPQIFIIPFEYHCA